MSNHYEMDVDSLKDVLSALKRNKKSLTADALKDHANTLEKVPQGGVDTAKDASSICRYILLSGIHRAADKGIKLAATSCLCQLLRLRVQLEPDNEADELEFEQNELEEIYKPLVWSLSLLKPGSPQFDTAKNILAHIAAGQLFVGLLDIKANALVRDVFKTLFQMMAYGSGTEVAEDCMAVMVSLLENADLVTRPVIEVIAKQMSMPADKAGTSFGLACKLVKRAEDALSLPMQTYIRDSVVFDTAFTDHAHASSLRHLLANLYQTAPSIVLATLPPLASELASQNVREAMAAIDLLSLLFSVPGAGFASQQGDVFDKLLAACDHPVPDARLKLASALPRIVAACPTSSTRAKAVDCCVGRFLDPDSSVRSAAVRGIGEVVVGDHVALTESLASELMGRLKDTTEAVRFQALKSAVRVYQHVVKGAVLSALKRESGLAGAWTPAELQASSLLNGVVEFMFRASLQERTRGLLPDLLPSSSVVPVVGDNTADARIFLLAVSAPDSQARECMSRLLLGQHRLRVLMADLGATRGNLAKVSPTKKAPLRQQADAVIESIAKSYAGPSSVGGMRTSLRALTEQKDNHVFACIQQLCSPFPPSTQAAAEGTQASRLASTQPFQRVSASSEAPQQPEVVLASVASEAEARAALLKDVHQRLRAASKEVITLLKLASMSLVSPHHVQALLSALISCSGKGEDLSSEFLRTVRCALTVVTDSAPLLTSRLAPFLLTCMQSEDVVVRCAALELAAGAARHMENPRLSKAACDEVVARLEDIALSGPCKSAGHAVRCVMLLPQPARKPALEHLHDRLLSVMRSPSAAAELNAVNLVHGMAQLIRFSPDVAAPSAMEVIDFALDGVMKSEALFGSLDPPSTATVSKNASKFETWANLEPELLHKRTAIATLAKSLVHGWERSGGSTHSILEEAIEIFCVRLEVFLDPETDLEQYGAHTPSQGGFLRLAAACALLDVALTNCDRLVTVPAFCSLSLMMQDPMLEVRRAFRMKLHKGLMRLLRSSAVAPLSRVSKYAAILCLAAPDPSEQNRREALETLFAVVDAFKHLAQPSSARNDEVSASGGGKGLLNCPEYSTFFALYLLGHHVDFPGAEELNGDGAGAPDGPAQASLAAFQKMLRFLLQPLLALSEDPPTSLALIKTICRICRICQDADPEDDCSANMVLLADIAVAVAVDCAGDSVAKHAASHQTPRGCCLPSRLFKKRQPAEENKLKTAKDGAFTPEWFELLPASPCIQTSIDAFKTKAAAAIPAHKAAKRRAKASGKPGGAAGTKKGKKAVKGTAPSTPERQQRGTWQLALDAGGSAAVADAHSPAPLRATRATRPAAATDETTPPRQLRKRAARELNLDANNDEDDDDDSYDKEGSPSRKRRSEHQPDAESPASQRSRGRTDTGPTTPSSLHKRMHHAAASAEPIAAHDKPRSSSRQTRHRQCALPAAAVPHAGEEQKAETEDADCSSEPSPGSYENDVPDNSAHPEKPQDSRRTRTSPRKRQVQQEQVRRAKRHVQATVA